MIFIYRAKLREYINWSQKKKEKEKLNSYRQSAASEFVNPKTFRPGRITLSFATLPMLQKEKCFFRAQRWITTRKFTARCYYAEAAVFTHATGNFANPSPQQKEKKSIKALKTAKNVKSEIVIIVKSKK